MFESFVLRRMLDRIQPIARGMTSGSILVGITTASLVLLNGCGSEDPVVPVVPTVAQVAVTPGTHSLSALGLTVQLRATATDQNGNTVPLCQYR